jgi:ArsR family transcriptional regulator
MNPKIDDKTMARLKTRSGILKALAHPVRLFLVEQLCCRPTCVCELTRRVGLDVSTVSKHLALLKNAGIVRDEKRGAKVFYHLEMPCTVKLFDCVESVMKTNARKHREMVG